MKGKMDRQWTGSKMRKKIKGKGYPKVVPLTDMLPHSLTRSASCWLILSQYLMVSQMEWVRKHELVLSRASEHAI